jgi:hypothetical protein
MKHNFPFVLIIILLFANLLGPAKSVEATDQVANNGAPTMVSYQGQVNVVGLPFSETGFFKFAIIDPPGTSSFWSNDGTSSGGGEPTHALPLPVSNGLFNVRLGDAGAGMPPLNAAVFGDPARLLRVWFSPDAVTFSQLAPDAPITSVPYALQAQQAADSLTLGGHPAGDFMIASQYLGRHWGTLVDTTGDVGEYSSIITGMDGLGLISYYDYDNGDLKVLHCGNLGCTSGNTITSVDTTGDVGISSSIAIGADGFGLISYYDFTNHDLKVFHCSNISCTAGTYTSVDTAGDVGVITSITIGVDALGLIAYIDFTNHHLKVLHCGNLLCDNLAFNTITTVDSIFMAGKYGLSIAIGSDGLGVISYWDSGNLNLNVLHCGTVLCDKQNSVSVVDTTGDVGGYSSITVGSDGLPLVSYYDNTNGDLKVVHCGNLYCGGFNTRTSVDTEGNLSTHVGTYNSITIGPDGLGLISYLDETNSDLKVVHCGNLLCNDKNIIATVDSADLVGQYSSITIVGDGQALISNYDHTGGDLKVIKMAGLGRR